MSDTKIEKQKRTTVRKLSAIELKRLAILSKKFGKRDRRSYYLDGVLTPVGDETLPLLRIDPVAGTITRDCTERKKTEGFSGTFGGVSTEVIHEHSMLDLYLRACKLIPGFQKACAARYKESIPVFQAKPAVAPIAFDGTEPPLKFETPLFDRHEIKPSSLCNALSFGATGSGKTVSFIFPLMFSMLAYQLDNGKATSMLVIDPKVELLGAIESVLGQQDELDRLVVMGKCPPVVYFEENDGLSLTDRFEKAKSFYSPSSADSYGDGARWQRFAEDLIMSFLKDDQLFANVTGLALLEIVAALVSGDMQYLERTQWSALRKILLLGMESNETLRLICDVYDVLMFSVGITKVERPIARYVNLKTDDAQFMYNARGALTIVEGLASDDMSSVIDMSVRRGLPRGARTDLAALMDRGAVLVLQPRQTKTHDIIGRALKSLFFRTVMERRDMARPIGYVVDEFQRYITSDEETGDHAFLDRCRAYRCNAVLASQSMSALLTAVGEGRAGSTAVDSLLTNLPTKACFRTTDLETVRTMQAFIPRDSRSDQHILSFRPPSSLLTGEYYFSFEHDWGRSRYQLPEVRLSA